MIYNETKRKAEWDRLHVIALNKIRAACRESKDRMATTGGNIRATPEGLVFGELPGTQQSWEGTSVSGMKKVASWDWRPNNPISPLERLAECADD